VVKGGLWRDVERVVDERQHQARRCAPCAASDGAKKAYREFVLKWKKLLPKVVTSLEAGEELLTFYRFPNSQWKSLRTTNAIERLNGEFRRRVKAQGSLPSAQSAELLLFGLIISGQIRMRRIDGWQDLKQVTLSKAA
jgi:putative transposase